MRYQSGRLENDETRRKSVGFLYTLTVQTFRTRRILTPKLLSASVNSWQTRVYQNVEGRNVPGILDYNGGAYRYRKRGQAVAEGGYKEFALR